MNLNQNNPIKKNNRYDKELKIKIGEEIEKTIKAGGKIKDVTSLFPDVSKVTVYKIGQEYRKSENEKKDVFIGSGNRTLKDLETNKLKQTIINYQEKYDIYQKLVSQYKLEEKQKPINKDENVIPFATFEEKQAEKSGKVIKIGKEKNNNSIEKFIKS